MPFQPGANVYTVAFANRPENVEVPHIDTRAPTTTDILYPIGKRWINTSAGTEYVLVSQSSNASGTSSNWAQSASSTGNVVSVSGTANQITSTNTAGAVTLSLPAAITAPGSLTTTTTLTGGTGVTATTGNLTATNGNLVLGTAGNKISIATGTNASAGTSGAMTAGSVVVTTTAITANSLVFFSTNTLGTVTVPQAYRVSARTPGTSFTIQSQDATDTSTVNWFIIN